MQQVAIFGDGHLLEMFCSRPLETAADGECLGWAWPMGRARGRFSPTGLGEAGVVSRDRFWIGEWLEASFPFKDVRNSQGRSNLGRSVLRNGVAGKEGVLMAISDLKVAARSGQKPCIVERSEYTESISVLLCRKKQENSRTCTE
jgi:hypothetical protein